MQAPRIGEKVGALREGKSTKRQKRWRGEIERDREREAKCHVAAFEIKVVMLQIPYLSLRKKSQPLILIFVRLITAIWG